MTDTGDRIKETVHSCVGGYATRTWREPYGENGISQLMFEVTHNGKPVDSGVLFSFIDPSRTPLLKGLDQKPSTNKRWCLENL